MTNHEVVEYESPTKRPRLDEPTVDWVGFLPSELVLLIFELAGPLKHVHHVSRSWRNHLSRPDMWRAMIALWFSRALAQRTHDPGLPGVWSNCMRSLELKPWGWRIQYHYALSYDFDQYLRRRYMLHDSPSDWDCALSKWRYYEDAIKCGAAETLRFLFSTDYKPEQADVERIVLCAIASRVTELFRIVLESGIIKDVDMKLDTVGKANTMLAHVLNTTADNPRFQYDATRLLLEAGAKPGRHCSGSTKPAYAWATANKETSYEVLCMLYEAGAGMTHIDWSNVTVSRLDILLERIPVPALAFQSLLLNHPDQIQTVARAGFEVNSHRLGDGLTTLHQACMNLNAHANTIRPLLLAQADVNARTYRQSQPLHLFCAAWRSTKEDSACVLDAFEDLVLAGADVNAPDGVGHTPLLILFGSRLLTEGFDWVPPESAVAMLIRYGADPYATTENGVSIAHLAAYSCVPTQRWYGPSVGSLVDMTRLATAEDKAGHCPLSVAYGEGNDPAAELFRPFAAAAYFQPFPEAKPFRPLSAAVYFQPFPTKE